MDKGKPKNLAALDLQDRIFKARRVLREAELTAGYTLSQEACREELMNQLWLTQSDAAYLVAMIHPRSV